MNFKKIGLFVGVISISLLSLACQAIEIDEKNLFVPNSLYKSNVKLVYDYGKCDFIAIIDGEMKNIKKYNISGVPSDLSKDQIEGFLKVGYFSLQILEDDYYLNASLRLLGGVYGAQKVGASEEAGKVVGGVAGAAVGGAVGLIVGSAIGGPAGAAVGAAIGASMTYVGEAAGNTQQPSAPQQNKK
jgi:hypothetical protein